MSEGAFITTEAVDRIVAAGGEEAIAALASLRDATLAARRANEDAFGAALHVRSALHHLAAVIGDDESARVALAEVVGLNGDAIEERWFDTAFAGGSALRRENIARLRAMPYEEYLASPEWQARRDRRLASVLFRCQVCNARGALEVHHRTYVRRGNEDDGDLLVLCGECHRLFHERMKIHEGRS